MNLLSSLFGGGGGGGPSSSATSGLNFGAQAFSIGNVSGNGNATPAAASSSISNYLIIGALAVAAFFLLKKK